MQQESVFENLKIKAAAASIDALETLQEVLKSSSSKDSDKIKAAQQIITIMEKAIDQLDVLKKYEELRKELNEVSNDVEYHPED